MRTALLALAALLILLSLAAGAAAWRAALIPALDLEDASFLGRLVQVYAAASAALLIAGVLALGFARRR